MTISLQLGIPENQRAAAVGLYWQAFGGKLGRVLGPEPKALQFLTRALRTSHAIAALDAKGHLLGIAGFKTPQGSFAGGELADILGVYGYLGAAWRLPPMWMLGNDVDNERFLLDGICVAASHRSRGIGTHLMAAIENQARLRHYPAVRLDVITENWRAKALYVRLGYTEEKTISIGVLRHIYGFRSVTTMVKPV